MISKQEKAAYDKKYRKKNFARLKAEKAAYFQRTYDPIKAAVARKKRMPKHVLYCQQPKYKVYKRNYDHSRRARKFGRFAEAYEVLLLLKMAIKKAMPDKFERYAQAGRHQWNPINQQRYRRRYEQRTLSNFTQGFSLGNP